MAASSSRFAVIGTFIVGITAVLAFVAVATRPRSATSVATLTNEWVGRPAPDFTLPDLNGTPVTLSALKGKVVVLDLWATWCPPCVAELPTNAAVAKKYADRGVVFYAVDIGESADTVKAFLARQKIDPPVLLDLEKTAAMRFNAEYIPLLVVIDPNGTIVARDNVAPTEAEATLSKWIDSAMIESGAKSGQAAASGTERPATRP